LNFEHFAKKALDNIRPKRINLMVMGINRMSLSPFKELNQTNGRIETAFKLNFELKLLI